MIAYDIIAAIRVGRGCDANTSEDFKRKIQRFHSSKSL